MPLHHHTHQRRKPSYRRTRNCSEASIDERSAQTAQMLAGITSAVASHVPIQTDEGIGQLIGEVRND